MLWVLYPEAHSVMEKRPGRRQSDRAGTASGIWAIEELEKPEEERRERYFENTSVVKHGRMRKTKSTCCSEKGMPVMRCVCF